MKLIFMGTPDFAVTVMEKILADGHEIALVVTQPDRPKGRGNKMLPPPVKVKAEELGIEVIQPVSVKEDEFYDSLKRYHADCFVVVAYGRILPERILNLPKYGSLNVHGSILPKYRGSAPIQRAVMNGETKTGVTVMQMDRGMDTGDILKISEIAITPEDDTGSMFEKLAILGGDTLCSVLKELESGKVIPIPQDDDFASYAPMIQKEEEKINWDDSAQNVFCIIRGMAPTPCAYTFLEESRVKIGLCELRKGQGKPGEVLEITNEGILVACGAGALLLKKLQMAGKKMLDARDFVNGSGIQKGMMFHG